MIYSDLKDINPDFWKDVDLHLGERVSVYKEDPFGEILIPLSIEQKVELLLNETCQHDKYYFREMDSSFYRLCYLKMLASDIPSSMKLRELFEKNTYKPLLEASTGDYEDDETVFPLYRAHYDIYEWEEDERIIYNQLSCGEDYWFLDKYERKSVIATEFSRVIIETILTIVKIKWQFTLEEYDTVVETLASIYRYRTKKESDIGRILQPHILPLSISIVENNEYAWSDENNDSRIVTLSPEKQHENYLISKVFKHGVNVEAIKSEVIKIKPKDNEISPLYAAMNACSLFDTSVTVESFIDIIMIWLDKESEKKRSWTDLINKMSKGNTFGLGYKGIKCMSDLQVFYESKYSKQKNRSKEYVDKSRKFFLIFNQFNPNKTY